LGEIWVRGDAVSRCCCQDPEATVATYVDGRFRIGDLAVWDEDVCCSILDHTNVMISCGGLDVVEEIPWTTVGRLFRGRRASHTRRVSRSRGPRTVGW
jgi:acyl-CoA synthetase (AMP-forming)/AMP-acid ligase II